MNNVNTVLPPNKIEIIKPVELHNIYGIQDFIVPCESTMYVMTDYPLLLLIRDYYDKDRTQMKTKYFLNHFGLKENAFVSYYENGGVKSIYHYHNNILNGKFRNFYPCGSLKDEGYYINNKIHLYHSRFYDPSIARNQLMAYIEYVNGEIMGRYSVYTKDGKLYKERYIYKDTMLYDIDKPNIYINKCDTFIIRFVIENNKVIASNRYEIKKYENDDKNYYIFNKHYGYVDMEEIKDNNLIMSLVIFEQNILFCYYYDRENSKLIVSVNEDKKDTFQKIIF